MNLREQLAAVEAELRTLHETAGDATLDEDQQRQWDDLTTKRSKLLDDIQRDDERRATAAALAARPERTETGDGVRGAAPAAHVRKDPFAILDDHTVRGRERRRALVDGVLRAVEGRDLGGAENEAHLERLLKRHALDPRDPAGQRWAENLLGRARPEYESGFAKLIVGQGDALDPEERAAIAVGTNTAGGYLVPTHLDPTLIITNAGSSNIMRQHARIATLTEGNVWNGVTTAGATASWDAEGAEVSDDTPAIGPAAIPVLKPQAFIQAYIEAFEDISGLTSDVLMLFADARDRLEGAGHMVGTGQSNQPTGLFTALNASTTTQIISTTAATIGEVDIHALYRALPIRWRNRASFVANPLYLLAVKKLGTAVSSSFSGDLRDPVTDRILGRPAIESDDAPTTQTTTALDQEVAFADLTSYVIVDKPGSTSIEFIPHLFNTANNLPDGRRGWYMHWRTGAGMPNPGAGRCLVDKTSA